MSTKNKLCVLQYFFLHFDISNLIFKSASSSRNHSGKKKRKTFKEAGAEVGQAQLKLGLDFLSFWRFGFSIFGWIDLVLLGLIQYIWFSTFGY